jgi:AAA domain
MNEFDATAYEHARGAPSAAPPRHANSRRGTPRSTSPGDTTTTERKPYLQTKAEFTANFVPPDYLIDGILQRRFVYALTGITGHGKTALALLMARLITDHANKNPQLGGHSVDHGNGVYFAGENPDDLRARMIADDWRDSRDGRSDSLCVIPGTFGLDAMQAECDAKADRMGGKIDVVIVDTSAAYFLGDDENGNVQAGAHARALRRLTELPGGPCVLVLCHPIKGANDQSQLVPRGGGAFIAELDGNLTAWKLDDALIELSHTKMRGPGFEPVTFLLEKIRCPALVDAKGRQITSIRAIPVSEGDAAQITKSARTDEDTLLVAMLEPGRSIAQLATACAWTLDNGAPYKTKVARTLKRLADAGLAKKTRGDWLLTDKGKAAADAATRPAQ